MAGTASTKSEISLKGTASEIIGALGGQMIPNAKVFGTAKIIRDLNVEIR
jgi:hypothetical protein